MDDGLKSRWNIKSVLVNLFMLWIIPNPLIYRISFLEDISIWIIEKNKCPVNFYVPKKDYAKIMLTSIKYYWKHAWQMLLSLNKVRKRFNGSWCPKEGPRIISTITQPFRNKSVIFQGHLIDLFFISVKL